MVDCKWWRSLLRSPTTLLLRKSPRSETLRLLFPVSEEKPPPATAASTSPSTSSSSSSATTSQHHAVTAAAAVASSSISSSSSSSSGGGGGSKGSLYKKLGGKFDVKTTGRLFSWAATGNSSDGVTM